MKAVYGIRNLRNIIEPSAVSVGVFDGVHIGHRKIIGQLLKEAKGRGLKPVVVTFDPHPAKVLNRESAIPMLCSLKHRLRLLEELGVEQCIVIRFNRAFSEKDTESFFRSVLVKKLNIKRLVIGGKFSFGKERLTSVPELRRIADNLGFRVKIIKPKYYNGLEISSSTIRYFIEIGRLNVASKLLGRPVSILGTVVHGRKRGRVIGFKTANINPHHEAIPQSGVYAVYSKLGNRLYKSVLNIGRRPTFDEKEPSIEAHIFGINKDIYNKEIEVSFVKKIRPERKFKSKEALRSQIAKDCITAKRLLY